MTPNSFVPYVGCLLSRLLTSEISSSCLARRNYTLAADWIIINFFNHKCSREFKWHLDYFENSEIRELGNLKDRKFINSRICKFKNSRIQKIKN